MASIAQSLSNSTLHIMYQRRQATHIYLQHDFFFFFSKMSNFLSFSRKEYHIQFNDNGRYIACMELKRQYEEEKWGRWDKGVWGGSGEVWG